MPNAPAIIVPGSDPKANAKLEKHALARRLVDSIFDTTEPGTPKRWRAIEALWYATAPALRKFEKSEAMRETQAIKRSLTDPRFGRSDATMNKGRVRAKGKSHGKHVQSLRVTGNMPESLYTMIRKFDPLGIGLAVGRAGIEMKRALYNEFVEYKIPEEL